MSKGIDIPPRQIYGDGGHISSMRSVSGTHAEPYRYSALEEARVIRLLRLLPLGSSSESIHCDILHTSLDDSPVYEALSYAWGDFKNTRTIYCGPQRSVLRISRNCFHALKRLRRRDHSRIVWVDAICIDQGSEEKNHQVKIMGDIFRSASRVLVFPGDLFQEDPSEMTRIATGIMSQRSASDARIPSCMIFQSHLLHIIDQSWFDRTWVVQEVLLAKELGVILGEHVVPWVLFCSAAQLAIRNDTTELLRAGILFSNQTPPIFELGTKFSQQRSSLFELLLETAPLKATDQRDKIFALMGIASDGADPEYEVNYGHCTTTVFRKFTLAFLQKSRNLDVLCACRSTRPPEVPTWIPYWQSGGSELNIIGHPSRRGRLFRADAGLPPFEPPQGRSSALPKEMKVTGIKFAKVTSVGKASPFTISSAFWERCDEAFEIVSRLQPYPTKERAEDVLLQTLRPISRDETVSRKRFEKVWSSFYAKKAADARISCKTRKNISKRAQKRVFKKLHRVTCNALHRCSRSISFLLKGGGYVLIFIALICMMISYAIFFIATYPQRYLKRKWRERQIQKHQAAQDEERAMTEMSQELQEREQTTQCASQPLETIYGQESVSYGERFAQGTMNAFNRFVTYLDRYVQGQYKASQQRRRPTHEKEQGNERRSQGKGQSVLGNEQPEQVCHRAQLTEGVRREQSAFPIPPIQVNITGESASAKLNAPEQKPTEPTTREPILAEKTPGEPIQKQPAPAEPSLSEPIREGFISTQKENETIANEEVARHSKSSRSAKLVVSEEERKTMRKALKSYSAHKVHQFLAGRRIIVTSQGYVGLAPDDVHKGDLVCCLAGAQVPFILREHPGSLQHFQLIGECYIHGIMNGEACNKLKKGDICQFTLC